MTLSPADDYPIHQTAQPVRWVATSDRNFYDRYYFNCHPSSDELFLIAGMGQYPNLGVQDAFALVYHDGHHRVVRASRELGADRMDTSVGPFRVEVLEGLKRLRMVLEPNEWDVAFDLTWEGAVPAHLEPQHVVRRHERLVFDSARLSQTGSWSGTLVVAGNEFAVTPDRWWGARDRSWGVRPVGEAEPPGIFAGDVPQFCWIYSPVRFADYSVAVIVQENADGSRIVEEANRVWSFEKGGAVEPLGTPEQEIEFEPGTRTVRRARFTFSESDLVITTTPVLPVHVGVGTGYGLDADWRHGMWQGPLKVEGLDLDLSKEEDAARMWGIVDAVARSEASDGAVGWGLFEYLFIGPNARYGWTGFDDA
ncbi:MAG TPA: hypothetical protein VM618_06895 [Acidimicrobiia bacterium]|nr:hypothetical protein [Acidimicrobiia bacterium]